MLTADERVRLIRLKVERAKKHINDLEREIRAFLDSNPYVVEIKDDPKHLNCIIYYLVSVQETPISIALLIGDAIQNLRTALDHLAHSLILVNGGRPTRQTGFPIVNTIDPQEYEATRKRKVQGMSQAAIDAIDATSPYKGGNNTLWRLSELNNIDKHRILVTVGSSVSSHNVPAILRRSIYDAVLRAQKDMPEGWVKFPADEAISGMTLRPPVRKCPLKAGDELNLAMSPVYKTDDKVHFTFEVAFSEPGIIESEPVLETLTQTLDYVDNLILSFKPLLV
jgi:hypothetical protein